MVGNLTLTGQTTQTAASWTGQWSMEDSNLQSNFQYTSNPNTEIVSLIHPITKTIIHLPISFSGQFDLKQPAYEDQPEHTLQISENNIKFTFKFLRGSSDPNVSQLTVLGKGKNQFGTFEVKGNLDLIHSNGTMLLSKYYVVAPKKSGQAKKAVVKRQPVPVSSFSSSSSMTDHEGDKIMTDQNKSKTSWESVVREVCLSPSINYFVEESTTSSRLDKRPRPRDDEEPQEVAASTSAKLQKPNNYSTSTNSLTTSTSSQLAVPTETTIELKKLVNDYQNTADSTESLLHSAIEFIFANNVETCF